MDSPLNSMEKPIYGGAFGEIFELLDYQPQSVIKYIECESEEKLAKLQDECDLLMKINHSNIINLTGTTNKDGSHEFGIIMEFCKGGTLKDLIMDPTIVYSMRTVTQWGIQLFDALSYLFNDHQIMHREIRSDCILIKDIDEYALKLSSFGLGELSEKTCVGTVMGTQRYKSPPKFDEPEEITVQKRKLEDSHRDDVYSLGLVLWEIIERRLVFAEYCSDDSSFNQVDFFVDILLKTLNGLEPPKCQPEIQEIVSRCTNFSRQSRPMAQEVLEVLKEILKKETSLVRELEVLPRKEANQEDLLRPIGFDGKQGRVPIKENLIGLESQRTESNERKSQADHPLTAKEAFKQKFTHLSDEEKDNFFNKVPKLIQDNMATLRESEQLRRMFGRISSIDYQKIGTTPEDLESLFQIVLLHDLKVELKLLLDSLYQMLIIMGDIWSPWSSYFHMCSAVSRLEELRRTRYTTNFLFKAYISPKTKEEWLDFYHFHFQKDFTGFLIPCVGKRCVYVGKWKTIAERRIDEYHFSHKETLDLGKVIEVFRKRGEEFETLAANTIHTYIPIENCHRTGDDIPICDYVFQLRNPPRHICCHEPTKCKLVNFYLPIKEFKWPTKMGIPIYKCIPIINIEYLVRYYLFLIALPLESLSGRQIAGHAFARLFSSQSEKLPSVGFRFLNCRATIKDYDRLLILLDHPRNYQKNEEIPCLTFDLEFLMVSVEKVDEYFAKICPDDATYTFLQKEKSHMKARILDHNRQPLTNTFVMQNKSTWPDYLIVPHKKTKKSPREGSKRCSTQ